MISFTSFNFPGQVKFHPASGSRSTLVMSQHAEDTSYWVEEKQHKSEIHFFKNYATDGYLGKEKLVYKKTFIARDCGQQDIAKQTSKTASLVY